MNDSLEVAKGEGNLLPTRTPFLFQGFNEKVMGSRRSREDWPIAKDETRVGGKCQRQPDNTSRGCGRTRLH
jgi:hypothetical protein